MEAIVVVFGALLELVAERREIIRSSGAPAVARPGFEAVAAPAA